MHGAAMSSKQPVAFICIIIRLALAHTTCAQNSTDDYVNGHNAVRSAVGVGLVSWNDTVAAYADNYANQRIDDCKLILSNGTYGKNLFSGSADKDWTAQDAIDAWILGQQYYDYANNTCAPGC